MSNHIDSYLDDLGAALRARGLASEQADDIIPEAASHIRDGWGPGRDARTGPRVRRAVVSRGLGAPSVAGEWEYRTIEGATAFNEMDQLEKAGREGWELIGCGLSLFCRRRTGGSLRWEYRRRIGGPRVDAEVAGDGWELATTWMVFRYYRRRVAG